MSGDWRLIVRGFGVAAAGAAALMLYIVAASAGFVGSYATATVSIVAACLLATLFLRSLTPFLDSLDQRNLQLPVGDDPGDAKFLVKADGIRSRLGRSLDVDSATDK
jgi:hypothetical protein